MTDVAINDGLTNQDILDRLKSAQEFVNATYGYESVLANTSGNRQALIDAVMQCRLGERVKVGESFYFKIDVDDNIVAIEAPIIFNTNEPGTVQAARAANGLGANGTETG